MQVIDALNMGSVGESLSLPNLWAVSGLFKCSMKWLVLHTMMHFTSRASSRPSITDVKVRVVGSQSYLTFWVLCFMVYHGLLGYVCELSVLNIVLLCFVVGHMKLWDIVMILVTVMRSVNLVNRCYFCISEVCEGLRWNFELTMLDLT